MKILKFFLPYTQILWPISLVLFITVIWCWLTRRTTLAAWQTPMANNGDALVVLSYSKAYMEDSFSLFGSKIISSLNAPNSANWNDWPLTEEIIFAAMGYIAKFAGLGLSSNILLLSCPILAGLSMWASCKILKCANEYSFLFAISFAFTHYYFIRGLGHITLALYWHIPLLLVILYNSYSNMTPFKSKSKTLLLFIFCLICGSLSIYYTFVFILLLFFLVLRFLLKKDFRSSLYTFLLIIATTLPVVLFNLDTIFYAYYHGRNHNAVIRNLAGLEIYGLKFTDLFFPIYHSNNYIQNYLNLKYFSSVFVRGEQGSSYLGLLGIIAFITLIFQQIYYILLDKLEKISIFWWKLNFIFIFSTIGGLNLFLGVFGLMYFRGTNRYSIFILAIVLMYFCVVISSKFSSLKFRILALMLIPAVLYDQLPGRIDINYLKNEISGYKADRDIVNKIEYKFPNGAKVFMLPVMDFPEVPAKLRMPAYDHLRFYLHSKNLQFSYGNVKGRGDNQWQIDAQEHKFKNLNKVLLEKGFSLLLINKKAYDEGTLLDLNNKFHLENMFIDNAEFYIIKL